jgi:hypothetical protein
LKANQTLEKIKNAREPEPQPPINTSSSLKVRIKPLVTQKLRLPPPPQTYRPVQQLFPGPSEGYIFPPSPVIHGTQINHPGNSPLPPHQTSSSILSPKDHRNPAPSYYYPPPPNALYRRGGMTADTMPLHILGGPFAPPHAPESIVLDPAPSSRLGSGMRQAKPKRMKAQTVTTERTESYHILPIPRDVFGLPILPLDVGPTTVHNLGNICMREYFHTERHIFPVNYEVSRYGVLYSRATSGLLTA